LIPRQVPSSPEVRPAQPVAPAAGPDAVDADVVDDGRIFVAPSAPTPPAWPPVPSAAAGAATEDQAAPSLPEDLSSALDITTEMPRVVDEEPAGAGWNRPSGASRVVPEAHGPVPVVPAAYNPPPLVTSQPTAPPSQVPPPQPVPAPASAPPAAPVRMDAFPDETMELPIFRELESAWFRSRGSSVTAPDPAYAAPEAPWPSNGESSSAAAQPVSAAPAGTAPTPAPAVSWPSPAAPPAGNVAAPAAAGQRDNGQMGSSQTPGGRIPMPEPAWRSAADEGWMAASAAAEPEVAGVTDAGLPKRVPMAQLVPGGVEKNTANANRRSPEQVRGLLSAYHRGVQRGRSRGDDDRGPESSTSTGHSPHGGKEQDA
jgi:hypothetical protein